MIVGVGSGIGFGGRSEWTPAGSAGLVFWGECDPTNYPTSVVLNGSDVSQLTDLSGNGHHLVQAVAGNQPAWTAAGTGGYIVFDATDNYLKSAAFTTNQPWHWFLACKPRGHAGSYGYMLDGDTAARFALVMQRPVDHNWKVYGGSAWVIGASHTIGAWQSIEIVANGAASSLLVDAGAPTVGNPGSNSLTAITLGGTGGADAGYFGDADVYALLMYSSEQTGGQLANIRSYLRRKAALAGITLP